MSALWVVAAVAVGVALVALMVCALAAIWLSGQCSRDEERRMQR